MIDSRIYRKFTAWKLYANDKGWKILRFIYTTPSEWETVNMLVVRTIEFEADGPELLTLEPHTDHGELALRLYMSVGPRHRDTGLIDAT